jgi:putative Mg2+ transporter-C (MgtC) family protein
MAEWVFFLENVAVALVLGILIGLERQWRQHPAGLRTNALVAVGAAMFVSMSHLMGDHDSPTRIVSYVVSGLGFLGGGVILREGMNVKGMNTAATIWCSGAIGALAGAGFPFQAATGTVIVLLVHIALRPVVRRIDARMRTAIDVETYYRLRVTCRHGEEALIRTVLLRHIGSKTQVNLQGLSADEIDQAWTAVVADIYAAERCDRFLEEVVARISIEPNVKAVSWERTTA